MKKISESEVEERMPKAIIAWKIVNSNCNMQIEADY
jgi:hypothetical protein